MKINSKTIKQRIFSRKLSHYHVLAIINVLRIYFMKKAIRLCLFLTFSIISFLSAYGQVGINTENPDEKAALEIVSSKKGVLVPRLTEAERDLIKPTSINQQSLLIFNTDEDCFNYWHKIDKEWKSLCGKIGKATVEITDCSTVNVSGQYSSGIPLTPANYITVSVNVTEIGAYTITAMPDPSNGYYFTTSGEFLATGTYTIIVPGAGTPTSFTPTGQQGNEVKISLNDLSSGCTVFIPIEDSSIKPLYTMSCGSTVVNGVYKINTPLNNSNTITMTLNVETAANGASYIITTNTVDGISFSGSGILIGGINQSVTLYGTGTPTSMDTKRLTITSNSSSNVATCSATVAIAYTKKRLLTIGSDPNGYGYNFSGTAASNKLLTTATNFGTLANSVVKSEGFDIINGGQNPSDANIQNWLLGTNPVDIVIFGYDNYSLNTNQANYLAQYLANGGVVLAFQDRTDPIVSRNFLQAVFSDNSMTTAYAGPAGSIYRFVFTNNEVLNGPFGDIRGLQWGEDASTTVRVSGLPVGTVTILSTDQDISGNTAGTGSATAFIHNSLNLIWVGDGGFNSSNALSEPTICPFKLNTNNFPIAKPNYGRGTKYPVYNSIFTANAIAWAMKKAQFKN